MDVRRRRGILTPPRAPNEGSNMSRRWLRNPLIWSPIVALLVQLAVAGIAAASTGGGDFPVWR